MDVKIGQGGLAGQGLYAARDFAAGETVVAFELQPLTEVEYDLLPQHERMFVHSYGARRYLYPAPARFINHSESPSCVELFASGRYVASRRIVAGEAVTIDATTETAHELSTFLKAYRSAQQSAEGLRVVVAVDAVLWRGGYVARGRESVIAALLEQPPVSLQQIEWSIGTGRWEALCSAEAAIRDGAGTGHLTLWLKVIRGNWQLLYLHVG